MAYKDVEDCHRLATAFIRDDYNDDTPSHTTIFCGLTQSKAEILMKHQQNTIKDHLAPKLHEIPYDDLEDYRQAARGLLRVNSMDDIPLVKQ
jgi:hypothetical protein